MFILIGMLFYPAIPRSESLEIESKLIPSWIKNNAAWWAEGQIDEESFLSGIEFLIENNIIDSSNMKITQKITELKTESVMIVESIKIGTKNLSIDNYTPSKPSRGVIETITISGKVNDYRLGSTLYITIKTPTEEIQEHEPSGINEYGEYVLPFILQHDTKKGTYTVTVKYESQTYQDTFEIIDKIIIESSQGNPEKIPNWIKNNAAWWAEGQITDDDFVKGIQFLIEHGFIIIEILSKEFPPEGSAETLENKKIEFEGIPDRKVLFPSDMDVYFPTNNQLRDKIKALQSDGSTINIIDNPATYKKDHEKIVVTKDITIIIDNHDDFVKVFDDDFLTLNTSNEIRGLTTENLADKTSSFYNSCKQSSNSINCISPEELEKRFLEKQGNHVFTESITIKPKYEIDKKLLYYPTSGYVTPSDFMITESILSGQVIDIFTNEKYFNSIIPDADAQLTNCVKNMPTKYTCSFLNGMTIGVGFEMNKSYDFKIEEWDAIHIEATVQNGLGAGLRIPFDTTITFGPLYENPPNTKFDVNYTVKMRNIGVDEYSELGLSSEQLFGGSEFAVYAGPKVNVVIEVFGEEMVNENLIDNLITQSTNFVPPLGATSDSVETFFIEIPCLKNVDCSFNIAKIVDIDITFGLGVTISGDSLTMNTNSRNSNENISLKFENSNKAISETYPFQNLGTSSYGITLANPQYHSPVYLKPTIDWNVSIGPISSGGGLVDLPETQILESVHETHVGTIGTYTISVPTGTVVPPLCQDDGTCLITTADNDLAAPGCVDTKIGCYTPNVATVMVGDVVMMTNTDITGIHTFTSGTVDGFAATVDGTFDSGILQFGDSFEYTADTVGEIQYYCMLHVWMQGVLIVEEASSSSNIIPTFSKSFVLDEGNTVKSKSSPAGIAMDSQGYVYVTAFSQKIQKFDSNGNYILSFGGSGNDDGEFNNAVGIFIDKNDFVYVADSGNNRIQKFDSNGNFVLKIEETNLGKFSAPRDIYVDENDHIFVIEYGNNRVQKFDSNGNVLLTFGKQGSGNGEFNRPRSISVDSQGNIYVVDSENFRIQKFDSNGNHLLTFGKKGPSYLHAVWPNGIHIGHNDSVYITDIGYPYDQVIKFDSNGNPIFKIGGTGNSDGEFRKPRDVVVDNFGNFYVTDGDNYRVQIFSP